MSNVNRTRFGKVFVLARAMAGINLSTMAKALGYTPSYLSNMEIGRFNVPPSCITAACEYFSKLGIQLNATELKIFAEVSNNEVSLRKDLSQKQKLIVSVLGETPLPDSCLNDIAKLLVKKKIVNANFFKS